MRKKKNEHPPVQLSPKRNALFSVVAMLLPVVALGLLEAGLRIFKYGGELDLVITRRVGNKELFSINRSVARRYFAQAGTTIPEPADDTFSITKQENTKRIFCLGESTMAGFPYEFHATAPGFLRDRLQHSLPQYNIEVINVGLSAVGSFVVLDFMEELVDYKPDLFVVYVGHNEFYGAYGVGSRVTVAGGPWVTRLTLALLKWRSFILARDIFAAARRWMGSSAASSPGTMMQQMAIDKTIPYNSPLYADAREIYRDNLSRMLAVAHRHDIPVVFSTLVSNLKDQPPFVAVFDEGASAETKRQWEQKMTQARTARTLHEAEARLNDAAALDPVHAEPLFELGKTLSSLQRFDEARNAFAAAKDRDALRFRATEEFQEILKRTCADHHVPVADVHGTFEARSPHNIIGSELILEHLHPNIDGYFLMAKSFAETIRAAGILAPQQAWQTVDDSTLMQYSAVSEFDKTVGRIKVDFLKRRWPFRTSDTTAAFQPANKVEEVALQYVRNSIAWSDARYQLAEYYAGLGLFDLARKECRAVANVIPFSYNPLLRIADYYRMEGKRPEAMDAYNACIAVEDNPYARIKLGLTYLEDDRAGEAARELEAAFASNETFSEPLSTEAAAAARYLYGVALAKLGRFAEARKEAHHSLVINPGNEDAKDLLKQIDQLTAPGQRTP